MVWVSMSFQGCDTVTIYMKGARRKKKKKGKGKAVGLTTSP
jgi:hypothetical protein